MTKTHPLPNITVSRTYREAMLEEYPGLAKNKAYWQLAQYLLFSTWRDETSGELIISGESCATMEERKRNSHYSAKKFFDAFSKDVAIINYRSNYSNWLHKCRTISSVEWSPRALALTQKEKKTFLPENRVWLSNGFKYNREHEACYRRETQVTALGRIEMAGCVEAFKLLTYLNNGAPNRFTAIKKYLPEARDRAMEICEDPDQQLRILKQIEAQAQPFYEPAERTTRVFGLNQSFLYLKREIREIMTQNWISCDLRSCQLAVISKVWEIPELSDYLAEGGKIWVDLCAWMGLEYTDENKSVLKNALYAIIFGAGRDLLKKQLSEDFPDGATAFKRLRKQPIIHAIFAARAIQIRKIQREGFGIDAFGKKYLLAYYQVEGKPYSYDSSRSIMAIIAQSYELKLLFPVVEAAIDSEEFDIVSWLHDGFCLAVKDNSKASRITAKLQVLVKNEAEKLGIATQLDIN